MNATTLHVDLLRKLLKEPAFIAFAISPPSLGGCFVQMDIGSENRIALQNLQIPVGSTNRTVPECSLVFLLRKEFPPNSILGTEMPTKKAKKLPNVHPRYALRNRTGCRGDRGLSATATPCQPSSRVQNYSQLPPNPQHIHFVEVKCCEDTRPALVSQLEAAHHQHGVLCQHLRRAAANVSLHTILFGVGDTIYRPCNLEP